MIYIFWAPPRKGKTYTATAWALEYMKRIKKGRTSKTQVFSNYPIYDKKLGSTLFWNADSIYYNITDSLIIIDEAYRDYSSRKWQKFSTDEHTFFATNGHNNNDIVFIVHGVNRLDPVIREMADSYYFIKKFQLPFMNRPLYFKIEVFVDEIAIAQRYSGHSRHGVIYQRFKKRVAQAYNTHFFREIVDPDQTYLSWLDMKNLDENNIKDIKREVKDDVQP
jgi:hypothetical protein